MAVRLRLRRMGKKKQPFYRIVAIDSHAARDGRYLENIGTPEALNILQEWRNSQPAENSV